MKIILPLVSISLLLLASCAGNSGTPRTTPATALPRTSAAGAPAVAASYSAPIPPKDAQWTLHCLAVSGPLHVEQATRLRDQVVRMTGLKDWYIIHTDQESSLYYGFYRAINNPRDSDTARSRADLQRITAMQPTPGERPFERALFVEINTGDPSAPPEWNILNKDRDKPDSDLTRAFWSLEIASYVDVPDRKQAAIDAVREARARGVEAYFYHGPSVSSVLIGAWPRTAVKEQEMSSAHTDALNQDQTLLILPAMPPGAIDKMKLPEGVRVVTPKVEPTDPTLLAAMRQYPDHFVNGSRRLHKVKDKNGAERKEPEDSVLIQIPRDQKLAASFSHPNPGAESGIQSNPYPQNGNTAPPVVKPPDRGSGTGRLRGLEE